MSKPHKKSHSKGLTFSAEPNNIKQNENISQSFDNKIDKKDNKIHKSKKNDKYVNLEEEDDNNNEEHHNGYSFFSSDSKDKKDKDEIVVNISHLDMENNPTNGNGIIDQINAHSSSNNPHNEINHVPIESPTDQPIIAKDSNRKLKLVIGILIGILIIASIFIVINYLKK